MKMEEAKAKWLAGGRLLPVTYKKSKAERIKWRDKESRAQMEAPILSHTVETDAGDFIMVNERVADTFKETDFKPPYKNGDKVCLEFTSLHEERGVLQARGVLHPLEK